jgi:hypothetical protein
MKIGSVSKRFPKGDNHSQTNRESNLNLMHVISAKKELLH